MSQKGELACLPICSIWNMKTSPSSASGVLGVQACTTMSSCFVPVPLSPCPGILSSSTNSLKNTSRVTDWLQNNYICGIKRHTVVVLFSHQGCFLQICARKTCEMFLTPKDRTQPLSPYPFLYVYGVYTCSYDVHIRRVCGCCSHGGQRPVSGVFLNSSLPYF